MPRTVERASFGPIAASGADGGEQVRLVMALVGRQAWAPSLACPDAQLSVLVADTRLILKPHCDRCPFRQTGHKVALRRTSGRRRINLHGALDLQTFHCPLVEAERVEAASTIALLEKLEADNPARKRIHVFADNARHHHARHHHARPVRQWLERPGRRVKLIFLPACAPHLNAIERSWGVMHRKVTHNRFHASFAPFAEAIDDFFQRRPPHEWRSWRDTITDNSRIISHKEFRALK